MDPITQTTQNYSSSKASSLGRHSLHRNRKVRTALIDAGFWAYKLLLNPFLVALSGNTNHQCRYFPSCSEYSRQCFMVDPLWKASLKSVWRVLRCNPVLPAKRFFDFPTNPARGAQQ